MFADTDLSTESGVFPLAFIVRLDSTDSFELEYVVEKDDVHIIVVTGIRPGLRQNLRPLGLGQAG